MKIKLIHYSCIISLALLLFSACEDQYPKVTEELSIYNKTNSAVFINYGDIKNGESYYSRHQQNSGDFIDTVPPFYTSSYSYRNTLFSNLWMSEAQFNSLVAGIKMYKIVNKDTFYVDKRFYSKKENWKVELTRQYDWARNNNSLTITDTMFNQ
jgi:hypothetical protein